MTADPSAGEARSFANARYQSQTRLLLLEAAYDFSRGNTPFYKLRPASQIALSVYTIRPACRRGPGTAKKSYKIESSPCRADPLGNGYISYSLQLLSGKSFSGHYTRFGLVCKDCLPKKYFLASCYKACYTVP